VNLYYYIVLFTAIECLAVAGLVWRRNQTELYGMVFGLASVALAVWSWGFSHYFLTLTEAQGLFWAKVTMLGSFSASPFYFHGMMLMLRETKRINRVLIWAAYVSTAVLIFLLLDDRLIAGIKWDQPYLAHYIHYNRTFYGLIAFNILFWSVYAYVVQFRTLRKAWGYQRNQILYFLVATLTIHITTTAVILPMEYNVNLPPFGFFLLPFVMALLGYALASARLLEFNVTVSRTLTYTVALLATIMFTGGLLLLGSKLSPGLLASQQILFILGVVGVVSVVLAATLPTLIPRAEKVLAQKLFGSQPNYQNLLREAGAKVNSAATVNELLASITDLLMTNLSPRNVAAYLRNDLSLEMSTVVSMGDRAGALDDQRVPENSPLLRWLVAHQSCLVAEELPRRAGPEEAAPIQEELRNLGVTVCVPMIIDGALVGFLGLAEKVTRQMYFVGELDFLETLGREIALALRYRRMQEEVFRQNRLVELGTIAAGVAHEIRNPLSSIRTFAQLMPSSMDDPDFKNEFSKLVLKDVERITKVIETMLAFARPAQVTIREHSVTELVEESVLLAQPRLKAKRIELLKLFHEQPILRVDKQQMIQVLVNLISNASDALPENGQIRVSTGTRTGELPGETLTRPFGIIEVADNGPGIPAAIRSRLFDPFFTTKKEGTGLGLSISQKIVRDHGGLITVTSVEGKGTTFQVHLPLA
jgi:two-component system, NtrC family, sensor kinase